MPLNPGTLKKWAAGAPQDAVKAEALEEVPAEGEDETNPFWTGEADADSVDENSAAEFLEWMEANEPDIHEALMALGSAASAGDEEGIALAQEALAAAEQYLVPEYPEFDLEQRDAVGQAIVEAALGEEDFSAILVGALVGARGEPAEEEVVEGDDPEAPEGPIVKPIAKPLAKPLAKPMMKPGAPIAKRPPLAKKPFGGRQIGRRPGPPL